MERKQTLSSQASVNLQTNDLSVHFGNRSALEGIDLSFSGGEIVCLVGPNGAGKSTLLRALAGILPPSHGFVRLNGKPLSRPDPALVYVPQRSTVDWTFPVSVIDVVLMARRPNRSRFFPFGVEDRSLAMKSLETVGMDQLADVQISKLSGGQQQRVFLARALLDAGSFYLLDEPFTGVDTPTQQLVIGLLRDLCTAGKSVIFATHDLGQAADSADRIILLNRRVVADGPPDSTLTLDNLRISFGAVSDSSDIAETWAPIG